VIGGRYVRVSYVYKGRRNEERIGKGVSKGGARLIVVGIIVVTMVCIVGTI